MARSLALLLAFALAGLVGFLLLTAGGDRETPDTPRLRGASAPLPGPEDEDVSLPPGTLFDEEAASEAPDEKDAPRERIVRGLVREKETERGMAGILVALEDAEETSRATARSDEEGRFTLRWRGPDAVFGMVTPQRGWVPARGPVPLTPEQLAGTEELVLELERGTSGEVFGRVLDPTGQGVFEVEVRLRQPRTKLELTAITDAGGRFRTKETLPAGKLSGTVLDHAPGTEPVSIHRFRADHLEGGRRAELVLQTTVGPTFWLTATLGPSPDERSRAQLRVVPATPVAALLATTPDRGATGTVQLVPPQEVAEVDGKLRRVRRAAGEPATYPVIPVRTTGIAGAPMPPWVRYPAADREPEPGWSYRLFVWTPGFRGSAELASIRGLHPSPVGIAFQAVGGLSGSVVDSRGEGVRGARVELRRSGRLNDAPWFQDRTRRSGRFHFEEVPSGSWSLRVIPERHAGHRSAVEIPQQHLALAPIVTPHQAEEEGTLAGELIVPGDVVPSGLSLTLRSTDGSDWFQEVRPGARERDGADVRLPFRIDGVPLGAYELRVGSQLVPGRTEASAWSPGVHSVQPPRSGILFRVRGSGSPRPLRFDVRSPNGRRASHGRLRFTSGWFQGAYALTDPLTAVAPPRAPFTFEVHAPGARPAAGSDRDVVSGDEEDVVRVLLEEGWGTTLYLVALDRGETRGSRGRARVEAGWNSNPLVGVTARMGGAVVGESDAHGRLVLSSGRREEFVTLEAPGWLAVRAEELHRSRAAAPAGTVILFERRGY